MQARDADAEALEAVLIRLAGWAAGERWIAAVYVFGSRAKGTNRPDSDLDIAVELTVTEESEVDGIYIDEARKWRDALKVLSPWSVDLDLYHSKSAPHVYKYVADGGRLIWRRS